MIQGAVISTDNIMARDVIKNSGHAGWLRRAFRVAAAVMTFAIGSEAIAQSAPDPFASQNAIVQGILDAPQPAKYPKSCIKLRQSAPSPKVTAQLAARCKGFELVYFQAGVSLKFQRQVTAAADLFKKEAPYLYGLLLESPWVVSVATTTSKADCPGNSAYSQDPRTNNDQAGGVADGDKKRICIAEFVQTIPAQLPTVEPRAKKLLAASSPPSALDVGLGAWTDHKDVLFTYTHEAGHVLNRLLGKMQGLFLFSDSDGFVAALATDLTNLGGANAAIKAGHGYEVGDPKIVGEPSRGRDELFATLISAAVLKNQTPKWILETVNAFPQTSLLVGSLIYDFEKANKNEFSKTLIPLILIDYRNRDINNDTFGNFPYIYSLLKESPRFIGLAPVAAIENCQSKNDPSRTNPNTGMPLKITPPPAQEAACLAELVENVKQLNIAAIPYTNSNRTTLSYAFSYEGGSLLNQLLGKRQGLTFFSDSKGFQAAFTADTASASSGSGTIGINQYDAFASAFAMTILGKDSPPDLKDKMQPFPQSVKFVTALIEDLEQAYKNPNLAGMVGFIVCDYKRRDPTGANGAPRLIEVLVKNTRPPSPAAQRMTRQNRSGKPPLKPQH